MWIVTLHNRDTATKLQEVPQAGFAFLVLLQQDRKESHSSRVSDAVQCSSLLHYKVIRLSLYLPEAQFLAWWYKEFVVCLVWAE